MWVTGQLTDGSYGSVTHCHVLGPGHGSCGSRVSWLMGHMGLWSIVMLWDTVTGHVGHGSADWWVIWVCDPLSCSGTRSRVMWVTGQLTDGSYGSVIHCHALGHGHGSCGSRVSWLMGHMGLWPIVMLWDPVTGHVGHGSADWWVIWVCDPLSCSARSYVQCRCIVFESVHFEVIASIH